MTAADLLEELDAGWRAAGEGVLRACSMTLIVVAGADDDEQAVAEVLSGLMRDYPSRAIVVRMREGARLEARSSIQCWMPFGRAEQLCSERIEIVAGREGLGVVQGLMAPDLPRVVWSRDAAAAAGEGLRELVGLAGKVIVDTSKEAPAAALAALARLKERRVADLAWARVTRWRERIAQEWPDARQPERAVVTYAGEPTPMAAVYLAAWLGQELGVEVELRCEDPAMPEGGMGRIRSVRLDELSLRRVAPTRVEVRRGCAQAASGFPVLSEAELLGEELGVFGRDSTYERVLESLC